MKALLIALVLATLAVIPSTQVAAYNADDGWYHCDGGTASVFMENFAGSAYSTKVYHSDQQMALYDSHWDVTAFGNCTKPAGGCPDCTFPLGNVSSWQPDNTHFTVQCSAAVTGIWIHRQYNLPPLQAGSLYDVYTDGKAFLAEFARGPYLMDTGVTRTNTGRWSTAGTPDRCNPPPGVTPTPQQPATPFPVK